MTLSLRRIALPAMMSIVFLLLIALARPASAQEEPLRNVDISFDVGGYDATVGDWAVTVVEITGDLADGQDFTAQLTGADGEVLWSSTQAFTAPSMRIDVAPAVAVGAIAAAGVSQPQTEVEGVQVERPAVTWSAAGGGGSGQLALSMVMAVIVVAIVFRSPLPSASTQRWTR
jgi:hypothetical protein